MLFSPGLPDSLSNTVIKAKKLCQVPSDALGGPMKRRPSLEHVRARRQLFFLMQLTGGLDILSTPNRVSRVADNVLIVPLIPSVYVFTYPSMQCI